MNIILCPSRTLSSQSHVLINLLLCDASHNHESIIGSTSTPYPVTMENSFFAHIGICSLFKIVRITLKRWSQTIPLFSIPGVPHSISSIRWKWLDFHQKSVSIFAFWSAGKLKAKNPNKLRFSHDTYAMLSQIQLMILSGGELRDYTNSPSLANELQMCKIREY